MNEQQRLFLIQSRSDFAVFELLRKRPEVASCDLLHYLQMTTEMLGKAHAWKTGPNFTSHRAIVGFLRSLSTNRAAQQQLGFGGNNEAWSSQIRVSIACSRGLGEPCDRHRGCRKGQVGNPVSGGRRVGQFSARDPLRGRTLSSDHESQE